MEALSRDGHQLGDPREVPVGIDHLGVPHVDRDCRQTLLNSAALLIEAQYAADDKGMAQIM